jgi:ribose 1,5-bisphosphokinase
MSAPAHRYAVYFAPPFEHPLWEAGCRWLGRDARRRQLLRPPRCDAVKAPWRYGWHATLKPPSRLAEGVSESAWMDAVAALARWHTRFSMPALQVATLNDFLALRPRESLPREHPLWRLADDCVTGLEPLRAPLGPDERARYLQPHFSARQRENVERHGYAHVLDDWRFHLSLTGSLSNLPAQAADGLRREARLHFQPALELPLDCDAVCVFAEPSPGQPFELIERLPLAGLSLAAQGERLLVVVGPSGAGKDAVLRAWLAQLGDAAPVRARRVITRPAEPNEDHEAVDEAAFSRLHDQGVFAFDWAAHGLHYGVRWQSLQPLAEGRWVVMNGSRGHLPCLLALAPKARVVEITASPAVLQQRLAARGREHGPALAERLGTRPDPVRVDLRVLNDGKLQDAVGALQAWWQDQAAAGGASALGASPCSFGPGCPS